MKKIKDGSTWGDWTLDAKDMVLSLSRKGRKHPNIQLGAITSGAELLDHIFHILHKDWATNEIVADLLKAFEDILKPRRNLRGTDDFDMAAYLKERLKKS